jgi:hypothetical protein
MEIPIELSNQDCVQSSEFQLIGGSMILIGD